MVIQARALQSPVPGLACDVGGICVQGVVVAPKPFENSSSADLVEGGRRMITFLNVRL